MCVYLFRQKCHFNLLNSAKIASARNSFWKNRGKGKQRRASSIHGTRCRNFRVQTTQVLIYVHGKRYVGSYLILFRLEEFCLYCRKVLSTFLKTKMDNHSIKGQNMLMKNATINKYRINSSLDTKIYPHQPNGSLKHVLQY